MVYDWEIGGGSEIRGAGKGEEESLKRGVNWDCILGGCLQPLRWILKYLALSRKFNMVALSSSCAII